MLDETGRVEAVQGPPAHAGPPVRLSLDIGVQHALAEGVEAGRAALLGIRRPPAWCSTPTPARCSRAVSLPRGRSRRGPADWLDPALADKLAGGTFELGSIFKTLTIAMALEAGSADLDTSSTCASRSSRAPTPSRTCTRRAARSPCARCSCIPPTSAPACWRWRPAPSGSARFWAQLGLTEPMRTEAGPVATPQLPKHWGRIETITIGYGHGLALAPLQFAAAMAALVNGGDKVTPTLHGAIRRRRRAAAPRLGGHQRQAAGDHAPQRHEPARHRPARGGRGLSRRRQDRHGRDAGPRRLPGEVGHLLLRRRLPDGRAASYVVLVMLFEPQTGEAGGDHITAGLNAAPATARIVERIAPCSASSLAAWTAARAPARLTPHPRHNNRHNRSGRAILAEWREARRLGQAERRPNTATRAANLRWVIADA